jgi:hypothetical protein
MAVNVYLETGAIFSPDKKYRYELRRVMRKGGIRLNSIGLNPSTASEKEDDPTIRREVAFALAWGYDEFYKYNLFGKVTPDPKELLWPETDPVGAENDEYLRKIDGLVVICWGSWYPLLKIKFFDRVQKTLRNLPKPLYCFGRNSDGEPKHPLYLPASTKLERW